MAKKEFQQNFNIVEHVVVLSENPSNGWKTELTKTSWYEKEPKYDIRSWSPDYTKCGSGTTLTDEEFEALVSFCKERD